MSDRDGVGTGSPHPLGATWDGTGTNFALYSEHAAGVLLCLFDDDDPRVERRRIRLQAKTGFVWHGYVPGVDPGTPYGYRVEGPWRPQDGHRFNPANVLIDPYARAIAGTVDWSGPVYGHRTPREVGELKRDRRDDAAAVPKGLVVDPSFDWEGDAPPNTPWERTIVYEAHVKGFTKLHPNVTERLRGTYAGLASPAAIAYLRDLGITAIELLPVHAHIDDDFLVRRGLSNYWGYQTLGFFAPNARYAASGDRGQQVTEFKQMVKRLHVAGIEVLLDAVYNHTCEAGTLGPSLSFKGIDNRAYYRLSPRDPFSYVDVTGTGNTLDVSHPHVLKLVMDSLRYWVEEMHVDGFRFDLAPALAREESDFSSNAAFFRAVHQDPVLSRVKLIAEPWDVGNGGYQLGHFPNEWREWNDRFRDGVRRFWRGDRAMAGEIGFRLAGSADVFEPSRRGPLASINFVTAHDGFTLRDVVSYDRKHNLLNGELNRDGADYNHSWNNGVEGPTPDPAIRAVRLRQIANMLATLLLSQGVPMLVAGDELGRTQRGNNNAYCQDNEISWIDWTLDDEAQFLLAFTRRAIALRRSSGLLSSASYLNGKWSEGQRVPDLTWYRPDGRQMRPGNWGEPERREIAFRLAGVGDEQLFVALNAGERIVRFRLPNTAAVAGRRWSWQLRTWSQDGCVGDAAGSSIVVPDRAVAVLRLRAREEPGAAPGGEANPRGRARVADRPE